MPPIPSTGKVTPAEMISQEITPDGNVIQTSAAPVKSTTPPNQPTTKSIEDLPKADDAPPKEDTTKTEDESPVDYNQFLEASGKPLKPDEKVSPKEEKKIETVPSDKKDEVKEPVKEEPKVELQKQKPKDSKTQDVERDYSDIDKKDIEHFKRMGNDAFNAFKPIYKEHKRLKNEFTQKEAELKKLKEEGPQLPESYYEHPESYLLDPIFRQNVSQLNVAQQVLNHWQKQYDKVAEGAAEFDFLDVDPQTGNLAITGTIKANRGSEAKLLTYINHGQNLVNKASADVQAIAKTHNIKYSDSAKGITEMRSKYFTGFYNTPENKAIYEPLVKQQLDTFPPSFRTSPIAVLAAESLVMNTVLAQLLQQASKEKAANVPVKQEAITTRKNLQPTGEEIAGDSIVANGHAKDDITIDDFNKVKQGY
jgi:hypothetical protein